MSTGSPILSIHTHNRQSTMQAHACTCTDGFLQQSEFQWQAWHDIRRHGQIALNQTSSFSEALSACPSLRAGGAWKPSSNLRFHLHPQVHPETSPLCRVALRNHVACLKYSCSASLDEKRHSSTGAPTFSIEKVWKLARRGAETDPVGGCWECVSGSKNQVSQRERI